MGMIFTLLGGDRRFRHLAALLRADGQTVRTYALGPEDASSFARAAAGADCVILPMPALKAGALNAPLAEGTHHAGPLLAQCPAGTLICAGMPDGGLRALCEALRLPLADYGAREDFLARNAALTAEGTLPLLGGASALPGQRVLVAGYGRVGQALARTLRDHGACVTVLARGKKARAEAEAAGCAALPFGEAAGNWDALVNTVPAPVFGPEELSRIRCDRCIDLASAPGGFDPDAAAAQHLTVTAAPGLPGKTAPEAAAMALRDAVYAIVEERK